MIFKKKKDIIDGTEEVVMQTWRRNDEGKLIHDGDCHFWARKICSCGLLHHIKPFARDLSKEYNGNYYEDCGEHEYNITGDWITLEDKLITAGGQEVLWRWENGSLNTMACPTDENVLNMYRKVGWRKDINKAMDVEMDRLLALKFMNTR